MTNALNATRAVRWEAGLPPVRLWLLGGAGASGTGEVMLLIWDAVAELPEPRKPAVWDESGRGLRIMARYSARSDFYLPLSPHGGKVARALIDRLCPLEDYTSAPLSRRPHGR
jgi:hypothetical protein